MKHLLSLIVCFFIFSYQSAGQARDEKEEVLKVARLFFEALEKHDSVIFNKILFVHHPDDLEPVLDGRTGLPT